MWYERACASATTEEVQGLCKLLHRHHLHSQTHNTSPPPQQQCSSMSVQLCLAVAAYCHPHLSVSEWRTVLGTSEGALADAGELLLMSGCVLELRNSLDSFKECLLCSCASTFESCWQGDGLLK